MNIVERITRQAAEAACSEPGCTAEVMCDVHATFARCAALAAEQDWVRPQILAPQAKSQHWDEAAKRNQWLDVGFEVPRAEAEEWVAEIPQWRRIKPEQQAWAVHTHAHAHTWEALGDGTYDVRCAGCGTTRRAAQ